jgi:hypothetical protein
MDHSIRTLKTSIPVPIGGSADVNADIGPLISAKQRDRVTGLVGEGQRDGATVVTGGRPLNRAGFFFEPTVVTQVRSDMRMMREEIFGPVVAMTPFDDEEAVIAEANNTSRPMPRYRSAAISNQGGATNMAGKESRLICKASPSSLTWLSIGCGQPELRPTSRTAGGRYIKSCAPSRTQGMSNEVERA